ncbi:MAG: hypothetical protein IKI11_06515 [Neisseriaceae bacterium]|nr:hypothetical protein [Neisseriaceae bacterium]
MSQNNFSASELLTFANLQIAAEALYGNLKSPAGTIADVSDINGHLTGENGYLVAGNDHSSKFTTTQAEQFAQNWKVVQHIANTKSGFSGTLFENTETHELASVGWATCCPRVLMNFQAA